MTVSGGRTKQLDIFCRVTGFTSDFLSFIVVELIRFFHGTLQLLLLNKRRVTHILPCGVWQCPHLMVTHGNPILKLILT